MVRLIAVVASLTLLSQLAAFAEHAVPIDHSTVRIVFVAPHDFVNVMGQTDEAGKPVQMATAGDMVVPFDSIRPVAIEIDGDFVGHALFGYDKVSPVFVLPSGTRKLSFSCEGFKTVDQEIRALGTGSTQYLIVKFVKETTETKPERLSGTKNSR